MNDDLVGVTQPRATTPIDATNPVSDLRELAEAHALRRVDILSWRDLEHPEAGGSEVHAARIAQRWAAAGIDVTVTASRADGAEVTSTRDGYRIVRPAGRYGVFPVAAARSLSGRRNRPDGTLEVWNGMPFFSPVWVRSPVIAFVHHVHGDMWNSVMPRLPASLGKTLELRVAPAFYRHTSIVTSSESSRDEISQRLRIPPGRVSLVPPGVDERFAPGPTRAEEPLVVAAGRLVPYKRFDLAIEVLARLRKRLPTLRAVIAGEGAERSHLEGLIARHGAAEWISLPGRISDDTLLDLYQRAWVLLSTSAFEGWGLTITEAAACATPAVASRITGHLDAVHDGISGILAVSGTEMEEALHAILNDEVLRWRLQRGALERTRALNWDTTALETLRALAGAARRVSLV